MAEIPEGYVRAARIVSRSDWESTGFRDHFLAALESAGFILDQVLEHPDLDEVHVYVWASPEEVRRNPTLAACPSCGVAPLILEGGDTQPRQAGVHAPGGPIIGLGRRETARIVCSACGKPPAVRRP